MRGVPDEHTSRHGKKTVNDYSMFISLFALTSGALRDLVPPVQFKKLEKPQWRSVTFSKVAGFSLQLYQK